MRLPPALPLAVLVAALTLACSSDHAARAAAPAAFGDDDASRGDNDDWRPDDADGIPDDYVAPWPQGNVVPRDYDETPDAGPLRRKAEAYDLWHETYHQPFYGANVGAMFADDERTVVSSYYDWGDSSEWTGVHLASQATRYHVTGDPEAKANAIFIARALDGHLHVTGTPGYIARYRGKQDPLIYQGHAWCDADPSCHHVEDGPYAGDFWWGDTSRDMYSGWFFGMSLAYDLVDDEDTRTMIRQDVSEILLTFMAQKWTILDERGQPAGAGSPNVLPPFRISWLTVGYHMTGDPRIKAELQKWLRNESRTRLRLACVSFFNRYMDYFGNCLSHETWYNLLRLGKVYFSADDYGFLLDLYATQVDSFTRLSHNPWFNAVTMGQGGYEPGASPDPYQEQLVQDLTDFPPAPHFRYYLPPKDPSTFTVDPVSVVLHDLVVQYPALEPLLGDFQVQALDPFPVSGYCAADFIFQWSPFVIDACGEDNPRKVDPGVDYLIPYWLASYHGFLRKEM